MIKHLKQSLKLGVFVDWKLCRDITFILPMNNQCFCACVKKKPHAHKRNIQKVTILGRIQLKWSYLGRVKCPLL